MSRQSALAWWRSLPVEKQRQVASWHGAAGWTFEMISASSSQVERIWKAEGEPMVLNQTK
jgi:hypothetical protein